jgi:hypothetical protein
MDGAGAREGRTKLGRVGRANREIHPAERAEWSRDGVPGGVSRRGEGVVRSLDSQTGGEGHGTREEVARAERKDGERR